MSVWFEVSDKIECTIQQVKNTFENQGEYYVGVISLMPGLLGFFNRSFGKSNKGNAFLASYENYFEQQNE
jgi:hypothetical protein